MSTPPLVLGQDVQDALAEYVDALSSDRPFSDACALEAAELVHRFIGPSNPYAVPEAIQRRAIIEVAADLWHRRTQATGQADFDDATVSPFRVTRNPMTAAYSLLRPYTGVGLA